MTMQRSMKFGRRVPTPSTVQIKHGLRMMAVTDGLVAALREKNLTSEELFHVIAGLTENYGISSSHAQMLSDRVKAAS